jgi:uncharacterized protein (UPF0128 family)
MRAGGGERRPGTRYAAGEAEIQEAEETAQTWNEAARLWQDLMRKLPTPEPLINEQVLQDVRFDIMVDAFETILKAFSDKEEFLSASM